MRKAVPAAQTRPQRRKIIDFLRDINTGIFNLNFGIIVKNGEESI